MFRKQATPPPQFARFTAFAFGRSLRLAVLVMVLGMSGRMVGAADVFDATLDFSSSNNPNGVWSAGYKSTLNGAFVLFDAPYVSGGNSAWTSSVLPNAGNFWKNTQNYTTYGVDPNQISLHPGYSGEYGTLRFTAPKTVSYYFELQFFAGHWGDTDGYAILNDNSTIPLFYAASTGSNSAYNIYLNLNAGDIVDVAVGSKGNWSGDNTPVFIRFTEQSVPEPSTYALGLIAAGAMAWVGRRRKGRCNQA